MCFSLGFFGVLGRGAAFVAPRWSAFIGKRRVAWFFPARVFALFFLLCFGCGARAQKAYRANEAPHPLKDIKITEKTGEHIDLSLVFTDERGENRPLSDYFTGPVLMTVVYYNCPSLCNFHLNGLFSALQKLSSWRRAPWQFVALSMDASEKPPLAQEKKANYLKEFAGPDENKIHFLTGSPEEIKKLTESLGFAFRWDEQSRQFAHQPVAYALSSQGLISRYLYGVEFEPVGLKLALLEAGQGKIGSVMDRLLLFCYRFDPKTNKYTVYSANIMKAGGVLIVFALLLLLLPAWVKERKNLKTNNNRE